MPMCVCVWVCLCAHTSLTTHSYTNRDKCKDPECEEDKRLKRIKRLRMTMPGVIMCMCMYVCMYVCM